MRPMRLPLLPLLLALAASACASGGGSSSGEYVDAMAREHAGHTPVANAATMEPRTDVVSSEVVYGTVGGRELRGYLSRPATAAADAPLPAVLVIHEWWGLNDNVRMMTRRLAGEGYTALAVDMFGSVAQTPAEARAQTRAVMNNPGAAGDNLRAGAAFLRGRGATRLGTIGWCFGGAWSLQAALIMPQQVDAAVMYYGRPEPDVARLTALGAPLLGLFGGADTGIPVAGVRQMESTLRTLGKDVTVVVYDSAAHAFANPSGQAYDEAAATDAWRRTTQFFARHLRGEGAAGM